jgi:hypothetical protein
MAKKSGTADHFLKVAEKHLHKVQNAWDAPTDWDDLTTYGLYCLEALIRSAALAASMTDTRTHWGKAELARELSKTFKLADVSGLLSDLNEGRKANAYGDAEFDESDYDAEDIANSIEQFYDEVTEFVEKRRSGKRHK